MSVQSSQFGGTGQSTYNTGDITYASAPNVLSELPIGSAGQVLTVSAGVPIWSSVATSLTDATNLVSVGTLTTGTWNATTIATGFGGTGTTTTFTQGSIVFAGASGNYAQDNAKIFWDDTAFRLGIGTATPSQSIDTTGNVRIRGLSTTGVVHNDTTGLLSTSLVSLTADVTGVLPSANGGAGFSTYTAGDIVYASALNTLSKLPIGTTGQVLTVVAGVPAWATDSDTVTLTGDVTGSGSGSFATTLAATTNATITTLSALTSAASLATVGTITTGVWNGTTIAINRGGTGQTTAAAAFAALSPLTTAGDIIYEDATPTPVRLPIGSTGQVLTVVAGLPAWATGGSSSALSSITAATATNTIDSLNFVQVWNWSTLASGNALTLSANSTSFSGHVLELDTTGASNSAQTLKIVNAGTGNGQGLNIGMTGASGAGSSISANNSSVSSNVTNFDLGLNAASATGTNARFNHGGTSGINLELNSSGATGTRDILRIKNSSTATTNNGAQILFMNNRTAGGLTDMAAIEGRITDIGNTTYKGALVFKTSATNSAPSERMRLDDQGFLGINNAAPNSYISLVNTGGDISLGKNNNTNKTVHIGISTPNTSGTQFGTGLADVAIYFNTLNGNSDGSIDFVTSNNGVDSDIRMTVAKDGAIRMRKYTAGVAQFDGSGNITSTAPGTSGNVLTSNGSAWVSSAPSSSVPLSSITAATATNTIDSLTFVQVWNWSTLASGNALTLSANSTSFSGHVLELDTTGASNSAQTLKITNAGTGNGQGLNINMSGGTGAGSSISANNSSVSSNVTNLDFGLNAASATGTNARFNHGGSGGINVEMVSSGSTGSKNILRLKNSGTQTVNNGAVLLFNNQANSASADIASIEGQVTDVSSSFKGALLFKTANAGGAPAEAARFDNLGQLGIGTTAPGSKLDVKGALRLSGTTSGFTGFQSAAVGGSTTFTVPSADGAANSMLVTDGAGTLSFAATISSTPPTIQKITSGSGTYTTPAGVQYIHVRMVGGGGGGSGSGTTGGGSGGSGSATTFGTSLLSAGAGGGGGFNGTGGSGGTSSLGSGPIGTALTGGTGSTCPYNVTVNASQPNGGSGASSPFGGQGGGGTTAIVGSSSGVAAATNTGSGGGGGGANGAAGCNGGTGGGSGGYVDALITSPAASYSYAIGTGGSAGTGGTNGTTGGAGGSGYIEVTEFYGSNAAAIMSKPNTTQIFTSSSGTYTAPAGIQWIKVRGLGGGGAGGGANSGVAAGGGGAGGYFEKIISSPSATYAYAIGAGGTPNGSGAGGNGGTTTFGTSFLTANGGNGGAGGNGSGAVLGGLGGTATGGDLNAQGNPGSSAFGATLAAAEDIGGQGAGSVFGGGGLSPLTNNSSGNAATAVGAGGSGSGGSGTNNGGAGFAGIIIVEEFYSMAGSVQLTSTAFANLLRAPIVQTITSGSGTYSTPFIFTVLSANATAGATYTNNGQTFTVSNTISGGTLLTMTATGAPLTAGTLTKATGTGDATITFTAVQTALYLEVQMVGAGGGGSGSSTGGANNGGSGGTGGNTTFADATAGGGTGAGGASTNGGGNGGSATAGSIAGIAVGGGNASGNSITAQRLAGEPGAASALGGSGSGRDANLGVGSAGTANTGGGGAGGSGSATASISGGGGGSGAYIDGVLANPAVSYSYSVGTGGTAGGAGTSGTAGSAGGSGLIVIRAHFQ